jgi:drug/metabolite transporter (DMT)-like permease
LSDQTAREEKPRISPSLVGLACGAAAALFWAFSLVSALHGISIGLTPLEIALHRLSWAGFLFLPFVRSGGVADITAIGWRRSIVLTLFGGIVLVVLSNAGFILVPLGHGGVIQPSCAALGGLILATVVLHERVVAARVVGAVALVCGLGVIGYEALSTFGAGGIMGDIAFALAGFCFALFGILLKLWRVEPIRAVAVISVLSLVLFPVEFVVSGGFSHIFYVGFFETAKLILVQGVLSGVAATFLFTRAVVLLGGARAAVFPALVPPFTLLTGYLLLGNIPSPLQITGLALVLIGFRFTQKT